MLSIERIPPELAKTKNFTKANCENGHEQMKFTEESSLQVTFFFCLEQGVIQSDALFAWRFFVAVEMLGIAIRQNPDFKGISFAEMQTKFLQHGDGITGVLANLDSANSFI